MNQPDEIRATAHLPTLDVVLMHRPRAADEAARLVLSVRTLPPEEAFARWLEAMNPLLFWLRAAQTAWSLWLPWMVVPAPAKDWNKPS